MSMTFRIISIGTLAAHPLWDERAEVRTGHATTTLISAGEAQILVDPSLPPAALLARMSERTPVRPDDVTHVFLTSFEPERRRALPAFHGAQWLLHEPEIEAAGAALRSRLEEADDAGEDDLARFFEEQVELLRRCEVAPDKLESGVDLFPLPGVTPGYCGLLLSLPSMTVLVCGDAVATAEHLEQGKVLPGCVNIEAAQESFREAVEIADALILGRGEMVLNPLRTMR
jgi:glyoxylase-like metal-dependent hydrolase (beta-lactamase superfamily II)